jgi:hypothetical protein
MAIGRFHEFGQTQHTGKFFELPYEMLRDPILKADQEYKEADDS